MEKFIILNADSVLLPKVYVSADILLAETTGSIGAFDIKLSYADKQITLTLTNATSGDIDKINDAVAEVWSKGYTEATIPVTLSSAVTAVS